MIGGNGDGRHLRQRKNHRSGSDLVICQCVAIGGAGVVVTIGILLLVGLAPNTGNSRTICRGVAYHDNSPVMSSYYTSLSLYINE